MDKNGLLEIIAAYRTGDDLDEVLRKDKDYQEALAQQKEAFAMLEELDLTAEQERVIDQVITSFRRSEILSLNAFTSIFFTYLWLFVCSILCQRPK